MKVLSRWHAYKSHSRPRYNGSPARANHLGCSLAEYLRRLVTRDLNALSAHADASLVFDLGCSGGSDVAAEKHTMLAEALVARHKHKRRSSARR